MLKQILNVALAYVGVIVGAGLSSLEPLFLVSSMPSLVKSLLHSVVILDPMITLKFFHKLLDLSLIKFLIFL